MYEGSSLLKDDRLYFSSLLNRTCVFNKEINSQQILTEFNRGYCFFYDYIPLKIEENTYKADFILSLQSYNAYKLDITELLSFYLITYTVFHPYQCDHIVTAVYEAFQNGLLWSNLELKSSFKKPRPLSFCARIDQKLQKKPYKDRIICLHIYKRSSYLEICITVEGKPIVWPNKCSPSGQLRGTEIIKTLCDKIIIDPDQRTIRLFFLYE